MTNEPTEPLTPAEKRLRALLQPFREEHAPHGAELTRAVSNTARWQRSVRRTLLAIGTAAAALGGGVGALVRERRSR